MMKTVFPRLQHVLNATRRAGFLASLALRLYLAPVFWMVGNQRLADTPTTIGWLSNPDQGLDLPFPGLLTWLTALNEAGGAVLPLCGPAVRWVSLPLMAITLATISAVHWPGGWQAIADPSAPFANVQVLEAGKRLARTREILREYDNCDWPTSSGSFAIVNNGIELAATYLVVSLMLFLSGVSK